MSSSSIDNTMEEPIKHERMFDPREGGWVTAKSSSVRMEYHNRVKGNWFKHKSEESKTF